MRPIHSTLTHENNTKKFKDEPIPKKKLLKNLIKTTFGNPQTIACHHMV